MKTRFFRPNMDQNTQIKMNKPQAWWLAIRPRTLPAAVAGVLTGSAVAVQAHQFRFWPALGALFVALLLQIGSNLANDVFDFEKGADTGERLGPTRVTQSGLLSPHEVKTGAYIVFALAGLIGLALAAYSSWWVLLVGALAILSALAYTAGPYPLGYHGLGEAFVFLFFGMVAVVGTYFVQAGSISALAVWMSIPVGLIIVGILVVNNLRDIESDRVAGKKTLAVKFGESFAKKEYAFCLIVPFILLLIYFLVGLLPWKVLFCMLTIPFVVKTIQTVYWVKGKPLNKTLGSTGIIAFLFSIILLIAIIL
jgi:1,4-dihydroxy-2-naphthoate polyprenyltransferase